MSYMNSWMSWYNGVDGVLFTQEGLPMPNVLIHTAEMVHTPVGKAPSGMIIFNPELAEQPKYFGFISEDEKVGSYFGPHIFKGTPFEDAPVIRAAIRVESSFPDLSRTIITIGDDEIVMTLSGFDSARCYDRGATEMTPFQQKVIEARATRVEVRYNGETVSVLIPPEGIGGGLPACYSPTGLYVVD